MSATSGQNKHGKIWRGAQTVKGIIHARSRLGKDMGKVKFWGASTAALSGATVASTFFMGAAAFVVGPFALAAPVALGTLALGSGYMAAKKTAALGQNINVRSYVSAKERGMTPAPLRPAWQPANKKTGSFGKKLLAVTGGTLLLAGGAGYVALDGNIDNLKPVFDRLTQKQDGAAPAAAPVQAAKPAAATPHILP